MCTFEMFIIKIITISLTRKTKLIHLYIMFFKWGILKADRFGCLLKCVLLETMILLDVSARSSSEVVVVYQLP